MGITPSELNELNGSWVIVIDFAGGVYEGYLHYKPDDQFPVQIWSDGCCYITYIMPEDITSITKAMPRLLPNLPIHVKFFGMQLPCLVSTPCCDKCLPEVILMETLEAGNIYSSLVGEIFILEWDFNKHLYKLNYPAICNHTNFYLELLCSGNDWVCNISIMDGATVVVNGIYTSFPLDCKTLKGSAKINLYQTKNWLLEETITISFKPLG